MKPTLTPLARLTLGAVLVAAAFPALAVGLGSPRGTVAMGRPLDIVIPVHGAEAGDLRAACVRLLPAAGTEDDHLPRVEISLGRQGPNAVIRLRGNRDISSPILDFRVRLECGLAFEKEYTLLPDPYVMPVIETASASPVAPAAAIEPAPAKPAAAKTETSLDPNAVFIDGDTSLRQMARQRYPGSAKRRVGFIRRMVAANPERFPDPRAAADVTLNAGERLNRPPRRATPAPAPPPAPTPEKKPASPAPATEIPPQAAAAPQLAPPKQAPAKAPAASDRLMIGSGSADKPGMKMSIGEATQAMDRMSELMNQQIQMQMEMTKQIGELHGQIEQLRSTLNTVQVEKQQVEKKLEEERSSPGHYLQLILAIVAGGLGGAGVLAWLSSRKRNEDDA